MPKEPALSAEGVEFRIISAVCPYNCHLASTRDTYFSSSNRNSRMTIPGSNISYADRII